MDFPESVVELIAAVKVFGFAQKWDNDRGDIGYRDAMFRGDVPTPNGTVHAHLNLRCESADWKVLLCFDGMSDWTTADEWAALLDGVPMEQRTADEAAVFVRERITEMAHAYLLDPGVQHKLARVSRGFGEVLSVRPAVGYTAPTPAPRVVKTTGKPRTSSGVTPLPPELHELVGFLIGLGFQVARDQSGGMGGRLLCLHGEVATGQDLMSVDVEVSGDRGHWATAVRVPGTRQITPGVWMEVLDGVALERQTEEQRSLAHQARYLRDRLVDMAVRVQEEPGIGATLERIGREYMRKRYEVDLDT